MVIRNGMTLMGLKDYNQMIVMGVVIVLAIIIDNAKKGQVPWLTGLFARKSKA